MKYNPFDGPTTFTLSEACQDALDQQLFEAFSFYSPFSSAQRVTLSILLKGIDIIRPVVDSFSSTYSQKQQDTAFLYILHFCTAQQPQQPQQLQQPQQMQQPPQPQPESKGKVVAIYVCKEGNVRDVEMRAKKCFFLSEDILGVYGGLKEEKGRAKNVVLIASPETLLKELREREERNKKNREREEELSERNTKGSTEGIDFTHVRFFAMEDFEGIDQIHKAHGIRELVEGIRRYTGKMQVALFGIHPDTPEMQLARQITNNALYSVDSSYYDQLTLEVFFPFSFIYSFNLNNLN
jgi:hypothetical protein